MSSKAYTTIKEVTSLIRKLHPYRFENDLIRVGPNKDGGYLIPNDLEGIHACFSPGVGDCSEFELWCFNRGIEIFLADGSIDHPPLENSSVNYNFLKKYLGSRDDSKSISLNTWVQSNVSQEEHDLLLQMDIEGAEYDCLINTPESMLNRFRIMVIEFHDLDRLWETTFFNDAKVVFEKILKNHKCVHIHPNNHIKIESKNHIDIPPVTEFTFIRKDRIKSDVFATKFPHRLDFDNAPSQPTIKLPSRWHKKGWANWRIFS